MTEVSFVDRPRNEEVLRKQEKIYDVGNDTKKKYKVAWTLHEKRVADDECNGRNNRWKVTGKN